MENVFCKEAVNEEGVGGSHDGGKVRCGRSIKGLGPFKPRKGTIVGADLGRGGREKKMSLD